MDCASQQIRQNSPRLLVFKIFQLSVLSFVGSTAAPDEATLKDDAL